MMLSDLQDDALRARLPLGYGGRFYGVYPALVSDLRDPTAHGRVQVELPWCPDPVDGEKRYRVWARLATLMAGRGHGSWFIPDVGDEVLVCFQAGDPRYPYILGGLWNGVDTPPEEMDTEGHNDLRSFTSRNGIRITMDDSDQKERLVVQTPKGHVLTLADDGQDSYVTLRDANGNSMELNRSGMVYRDRFGNTITQSESGIEASDTRHACALALQNGEVSAHDQQGDAVHLGNGTAEMKSAAGPGVRAGSDDVVATAGIGRVTVAATGVTAEYAETSVSLGPMGARVSSGPNLVTVGPQGVGVTGLRVSVEATMVELTAPMVTLTAPLVSCAGVLQCQTLLSEAVVASSYTPGGGNIL